MSKWQVFQTQLLVILTDWLTYILTYLLTHLTYLLIHSLTHPLTNLVTYLLTYLLTHLLTYLLTYIFTYLLTLWNRVLQKLTGLQPFKKFPVFYVTRRFITAFTSAHFLRIHLNLIPHLRLCLPSGLFPWTRLSPPHPSYIPRPSHSSRFYHTNNSGWGVQIMKLFVMKSSPLLYCAAVGNTVHSFTHALCKFSYCSL
jgi:hypothetical protein